MTDTESPAAKSTRRRKTPVEDVNLPDDDDAKARALATGGTVQIRAASGDVVATVPDAQAEVTEFIWQRLTRPFEPEHIERKPQALKRDDQDKGRCDSNRYSADGHYCGGWHVRSVHLDYIGHAGITTRLNDVLGPEGWEFEPYALTPDGLPVMGREFFARLTILGVTKWDLAANYNSLQEAYGDALRRCAMRFGIGTYLWSKSEAAYALAATASPEPNWDSQAGQAVLRSQAAADPTVSTVDLLAELDLYAGQLAISRAEISAKWRQHHGDMPVEVLDGLTPEALLPLVESIRTYLAQNPPLTGDRDE